MEEKVTSMLKIICDDGDSFAKRAEMYFRQRPDLVIMVEETYREYRALAERYDHLSKDLQSANRTIASVFPEQVPFAMDEEDENGSQASTSPSSPDKPGVSKPSIPRPPVADKDFRSQPMLMSRKGQVKKALSSAKAAAAFTSSELSENEVVVEIDKLQKEILAMETEAEFVRSSYEQEYEKFCEIQNQIAEKQKKLCYLQNEFGVGSIIDDKEAGTLMATRAVKSCQDSLDRLKEKHEQSTEEARVESRRIKGVNQTFEALKNEFNSPHTNQQEKQKSLIDMVCEIESLEKEKQDSEVLRKEIEEKLEASSNHSLTVSQLAEKIDDLVQRVVNLEMAVFSENAMVKRLKSEVNELQAHVKSLDEDKEAVIEGSDITNKRMNGLEMELSRVRDLVKTVIAQNNSLKTHFTEASCNINHLSVKLQAVKMEEEVEITGMSHDRETEEHQTELAPMEGKGRDASPEGRYYIDSESSNKFDVDSEKGLEQMEEDKAEKKYISETASSIHDAGIEELETDGDGDEEEQPKWRQMYLNGLDDREKILLDERSSVLRNYEEVRKKLNEVDKQNREGFSELALQIKELKNALASRDGEIQSLRRKKSYGDENKDENVAELEAPRLSASQESTLTDSIQTSPGRFDESPKKIGNVIQVKPANQPRSALTIADKIRSGIDGLLEENLEFWLRFSISFHQIHKYQTSIQDLKAELSKLRDKKRQKGNEEHLKSEALPIYSHLREIKTELTLWLENNAALKDEVQGRYSSLCSIQEEIARVTNVSGHAAGETELNGCQAAKFQGEVLNMKQENNKVCDELKAGFVRVRQLKHEVGKVMVNLERELLVASASTTQYSGSTTGRPRIPLRSFLFGIKLKNKRLQKGP
ncbi:hypothetical protein DITRI_Ditri03aG0172800 [Diplodiscus trichospermus]